MTTPLTPVEALQRDLRWIADMSAKLDTVPLDTVMIPVRNLAYMYRTCAAALELAKAAQLVRERIKLLEDMADIRCDECGAKPADCKCLPCSAGG